MSNKNQKKDATNVQNFQVNSDDFYKKKCSNIK